MKKILAALLAAILLISAFAACGAPAPAPADDGGKQEEAAAQAEPTTKVCPYCKSEIAIDATRCPHCTSELKVEKAEKKAAPKKKAK